MRGKPRVYHDKCRDYVRMLQCRYNVKTHGRRQLELEVKYPLLGREKYKRYELDLFVFSPYQLGMTHEGYGVSRFLRDMRSYTRYTIYSISLKKLADPSCSISPIARVASMLDKTVMAGDIDEQAALYELRVLASVYNRQLRDTLPMLEEVVRSRAPAAEGVERLKGFLADIDMFLQAFRSLRPRFCDTRISDLLRQGLCWADESISLSTEKTLYKLHDLYCERNDMAEACGILEGRLGGEQQYRMDRGYPTVVTPDDPAANEFFVYRAGVLKKWTEGCMFMTTEHARITGHFTHLMMAAAAGAAMAFAVLAALFAQRWFVEFSIPWVVIIVLAYIGKDRIKEVLRTFFAAYVPKMIADEVDDLIDPAIGTKIGSSRARALFCHPGDLPEAARRLRNFEENVFQNIIPPENVIHFHKDISIDRARLMRNHQRLESLTEIMRLKLDSWLANMDEPVDRLFYMRNGRRMKADAKRVYHVNIIVGISEAGKSVAGRSLFRYRLVLTRNGIVRIERVSA